MERTIATITKEQLIAEMNYLDKIYDVVRLVDPSCTTVMNFKDGEIEKAQMEPCFSVWEKEERCQNCISMQACAEGRRETKFEFRQDEAYYVLSMPYRVIEEEKETLLALELVNKVSRDFQVYSQGGSQTSDLVQALSIKSYEDTLTGVFNRKYYDEKRYLYDQVQNFPKRFGFLMIDINQFTLINERYGQTHGDELLAKIGETLRRSFRDSDKVIRIGGDEFLIVVRDCNQLFLEKKVNQIKRTVAAIRFDWMKDRRATIAVGIGFTDAFLGQKEQIDELFETAEQQMHFDKETPLPITLDKTILIVDDLKINREFLKAELPQKFQVLEAEGGQDALVILKTNHVDLILTDIFMRPMNGYEFMKKVRSNSNTKNIPIIAVTENEESSQSQAIAAGADVYIDRLTKPDALVKAIMQLTGHDHGRRDLFDMDFVLDSIPGAVIVSKFITKIPEILYCSRGIHNITGAEAEEFCEMVADKGEKIIFPNDFPKFQKCIKKIIKTKSRGEIIFRSYTNDGKVIWLWLQARYIGQEDGAPILEQIILDVSNSTNMYESILDESSALINVINIENKEVLYANKKSIEISGDSVGKICYQTFCGTDEPCKNCIISKEFKGSYEQEYEINNKIYKQIFKKMVWNGRDALLERMEDITKLKELQKLIEDEKDILNEMVQNVPAGLFVFKMNANAEIEIVQANPSACDLMGIDFNNTIGANSKQVFELTHPEDRDTIADVIRKMQVPGTTVPYEYRQYNKAKKEYVWLSASAHSVLKENGELNIYISYFDISEQKKMQHLEEDLQIAQKENRAKTDFMSNMSHDMRTPLNGMLGIAYLMQDKTDVEELHNDAKQLTVSGKLLLNLINDTLDMNKVESGKLALNLKTINSGEVFENVITTAEILSRQTGVTIKYEVPTQNWIPVKADAARLEQIMINVITNAVKYSHEGGIVELHMQNLSTTDTTVTDEYMIIDHGIGMTEQFLPHIFEPFVQEGRVDNSIIQGSGLGMSIVKKLVDLMDGTINVDSKINEGTKVTIVLSFEISREDAIENTIEEARDVDIKGMRILVCEDHPLNREIIIRLLNKKGVQVDAVENGREGIRTFEKSEVGYYDAILMDVRMPVMDGLEAAKAIRSLDKKEATEIPIIAMTANAFEEDKEATRRAGMNEHLAKPVNPELLYQTLANYYYK